MTSLWPDGLALLRIRAEGSLDRRGRIIDSDGIAIASCEGGQALWIGDRVSDAAAVALAAAFDRAPAAAPGEPPPALDDCAQILASTGIALQRSGGPSYVFPAGVQLACDATIERSGGSGADRLRGANPGNWDPTEWKELLDGRLGPWAIAVHGEQAISICHTPGPMTARAAECGVWTDPRFRGRGHAAATAAAWVPLVRAPQRALFYSTDMDNLSSQGVARRLRLERLGWTWRLRCPRREVALHPLCSLARASRSAQ